MTPTTEGRTFGGQMEWELPVQGQEGSGHVCHLPHKTCPRCPCAAGGDARGSPPRAVGATPGSRGGDTGSSMQNRTAKDQTLEGNPSADTLSREAHGTARTPHGCLLRQGPTPQFHPLSISEVLLAELAGSWMSPFKTTGYELMIICYF